MILLSYFLNDVEQFTARLSFEHQLLVVRVTLATLYKKEVHIGALNVELFDAILHASSLLY